MSVAQSAGERKTFPQETAALSERADPQLQTVNALKNAAANMAETNGDELPVSGVSAGTARTHTLA